MAILAFLLVTCNTWLTSLILLNTYNNVMEDLTSKLLKTIAPEFIVVDSSHGYDDPFHSKLIKT